MDGFSSILNGFARSVFTERLSIDELKKLKQEIPKVLEDLKTELPKFLDGRINGMQINSRPADYLKTGIYLCNKN